MSNIDCGSISKEQFLKLLWNNAQFAPFFYMQNIKTPDEPTDEEYSSQPDCIDYLNGKCIKIDFKSYPYINPIGFNSNNKITIQSLLQQYNN